MGDLRRNWPLGRLAIVAAAGVAAAAVVLSCLLILPKRIVAADVGKQRFAAMSADQRATAVNDTRTTLVQALGGGLLLLGAYFTYRQVQNGRRQLDLAREQLLQSERSSREQLNHAVQSGKDERALARAAQVTERFTRAIEQLGSEKVDLRLGGIYALRRIANDSEEDRSAVAEVLTAYIRGHAPWPPRLTGQVAADTAIEKVAPLRLRTVDVHAALHAALAVLSQLRTSARLYGRFDLEGVDLRRANLPNADLHDVLLYNSTLRHSNLQRCDLQRASLSGADLRDCSLLGADLEKADLTGAQLENAAADADTKWPDGFQPEAHGVEVIEKGSIADKSDAAH